MGLQAGRSSLSGRVPVEDSVKEVRVRCAVAFCLMTLLASGGAGHAAEVGSEWMAGYAGGPAGQVGVTLSHFVEKSSLSLRLGAGYSSLAPGDAAAAREIFINDATNGTPEKSGHALVWSLDFVAPLSGRPGSGWSLSGGPRYSRFTANFKYVGGNEDFDVRCHQWGLGGGAEYTAPMTSTVSLRLGAGADYFFPAALDGHDTTFYPDNQNVNARKDYTYEDADRAINQPSVRLRCQAGLLVRLGSGPK
jgi:hypothetical protein